MSSTTTDERATDQPAKSPYTEAVRWVGDAATGHLELLDQRRLPHEEVWLSCTTSEATADAIADMVVRGAPAIGLTASYGVVLAAQELGSEVTLGSLERAFDSLSASRPTAVNLAWALERARQIVASEPAEGALEALYRAAAELHREDVENNRQIGALGAELLPEDCSVLTHCNTGSLATAGYGTALGVVRSAHEGGRLRRVLVDETRPYLQGARLTMWELMRDEIPAWLITDSMGGHLMARGEVDAVVVGADRIAANGDTANKIGTYTLAVLAKHHGIPFYVAAPVSTIDFGSPSGDSIPIEERAEIEVTELAGTSLTPAGAQALHPAFDVTPASLITAIITERGVARSPYSDSLGALRTG